MNFLSINDFFSDFYPIEKYSKFALDLTFVLECIIYVQVALLKTDSIIVQNAKNRALFVSPSFDLFTSHAKIERLRFTTQFRLSNYSSSASYSAWKV